MPNRKGLTTKLWKQHLYSRRDQKNLELHQEPYDNLEIALLQLFQKRTVSAIYKLDPNSER